MYQKIAEELKFIGELPDIYLAKVLPLIFAGAICGLIFLVISIILEIKPVADYFSRNKMDKDRKQLIRSFLIIGMLAIFLPPVVFFIVPIIVVIGYVWLAIYWWNLPPKAIREAIKRDEARAEQQKKNLAIAAENRKKDIEADYQRIRERIREICRDHDIHWTKVERQLEKLKAEYNRRRSTDFSGVSSTRYFTDYGWRLLLEFLDGHGVDVCFGCETINPDRCQNGHCQKCNSSANGRGCFLCAKAKGLDVCDNCRTVEPRRCKQCGDCGHCQVSIYEWGLCQICD